LTRVLITRSPHQASDLADRLRAAGIEPILIPTISLVDPTSFAALDDALGRMDGFHWLIFTSANAVEAFGRRAFPPGLKPDSKGDSYGTGEPVPLTRQSFDNIKIAAIGPATARAVKEMFGREPDLVPKQAVAESLAEALLPYAKPGVRFLLVRAQLDRGQAARDPIPYAIRATGAELTIAPAYRTVIPRGSAEQIKFLFSAPDTWPDAITFTSSSTATNLFALLGDAGLTLPPEILRASIGPITSQTLRDLGYPPQLEAPEPTIPALVEILVKTLSP
jgi:uroporphyrinogen-III synthase